MASAAFIPLGVKVIRINYANSRLYHIGRASSVHTAIARGIRKSNGVAFRGKSKPSPDDPREKYRASRNIPEYTPNVKDVKYAKGERLADSRSPWEGRGKMRETIGPRIRKGKKDIALEQMQDRKSVFSDGNRAGQRGKPGFGGRDEYKQTLRDFAPNLSSTRFESESPRFRGRSGRGPTEPSRFGQDREGSQAGKHFSPISSRRESTFDDSGLSDPEMTRGKDAKVSRSSNGFQPSMENAPYGSKPQTSTGRTDYPSRPSDRHIPLSIPYTTPASEFLYGTSPILAALQSSRQPRRKLYKLYMHSTPQREDLEQDQRLIRLARRAGVTVEKVTGDGIRLLDKMSNGRPHNGYILEASPLPKLPVLSLGSVTPHGFEIVLGHQSREDAAVNGTETFIPTPHLIAEQPKRNPLILYLDSITDPGNLGGIIRTASFLGVTGIAISTRNSAPFSPVVLKAAAGAAENLTIFSVDKPAGFIVDSKAAGWKIYAAVAPEKGVDRPSMSAEKLDDPLVDSPVILMLGSEGEGLRWNLRSKADVDLYIRGSRARGGVDSLNVSVAAGILCNAFQRASKRPRQIATPKELKVEPEEADGKVMRISENAQDESESALVTERSERSENPDFKENAPNKNGKKGEMVNALF